MKFLLVIHLLSQDGLTSKGWAITPNESTCTMIGAILVSEFNRIDTKGGKWFFDCEATP